MAATTRPLDLLGLLFLIDFLAGRLVPGGPPWWQPSLTIISVLVWVAFVIDYTARLILSPHRWDFIRAHPLDLLMVLLPMLRVLRAILLVRRSFKNVSTERIAGSLLAIVGIGLIGTVSATVAAWFVKHKPPRRAGASTGSDATGSDATADGTSAGDAGGTGSAAPDVAAALASMTAQLRELSDRQVELQRSIDRLTGPPG